MIQINLLTIDVEEWFHTSALGPYIREDDWEVLPSRLKPQVGRILDILDRMGAKATFFVLGWVAERFPELVREIDAHGHEIASHGYRHRLIYDLSPDKFREYLTRSKAILEDIIGKPVIGYRATSFSIVTRTLWALDMIKEAGFLYDSSIFPIGHHDLYGIEGFPRYPYAHVNGLVEIPPSTLKILGKNIPFGGGGYFRLYPYWLTWLGIRKINREGYPAMVYLHPWELNSDCPRVIQADRRTRFRQYVNLRKTEPRLKRLLMDFQWGPIRDYLHLAQADGNKFCTLQSGD
jgi:polysaccharide deacetylase family protein (PEP-CTERM system associated)